MTPWKREASDALPPDGFASGRTSLLEFRFRRLNTALALFLEAAVPALLPAAALVALFFISGWLGLFIEIGPMARAGVMLALALALIAMLRPALALRWPSVEAIDRRLDRSRPEFHRPLATLADRAAETSDPVAAALWSAHQRRAERAASALTTLPADVALRNRDRFALRAAALVALVAAAFIAGDERRARIEMAFDWTTPRIPPTPPRLDAWIDPPTYTARPPIFLSGTGNVGADEIIKVPVGSILTIRTTNPSGEGKAIQPPALDIRHGAGLEVAPQPEVLEKRPPKSSIAIERRVVRADATIAIGLGGRDAGSFRLAVIPDRPPSVALNELSAVAASPDRQQPGGIKLGYTLADDYGIAKGEIFVERVARSAADAGPPLYPPPTITLPLRLGNGEIIVPTEDHPWAGEEVRVRIQVEDDIGQKAQSDGLTVTLPQRPFTQPLARALVEQRRHIVFSPGDLAVPRLAFDALLFEPERYTPKVSDFLALDMIRSGLRTARDREKLKAVTEEILELALFLENGDMTDAEKRLREAEARLRDAIEREAPPEEIKRLAEELRRAMDEFLREFAERALRDQDRNSQDRSPVSPERMMTQRDLQEMLKKIEELARSGKTAEAQQLLNQLKQMLENLRSARRRDVDPKMRELGQQLEEIDRLQREQRDLRDRTFREGQQGQRGQRGQQRQQGQRGPQGQQGEQGLQDQQQALRNRLNQLRERLRQRGIEEGEGFGEAENGMEDAEGKLGQGQNGEATQGQQRALDGMGRAAQGLAQQLQQMLGQGEEPGEGEGEGPGQPGPGQRGRADSRFDPLGRRNNGQNRDFEDSSKYDAEKNGNIQGSVSERTERVLRELRRRLGEFERPKDELDYLERLLRQR